MIDRLRLAYFPRHIQGLHQAADLRPGLVLHKDTLFASGLLVERGNLLSHSAIMAREMGIPAIVSISGVTRWLSNGDTVEFDGASGIVRRTGGGEEKA